MDLFDIPEQAILAFEHLSGLRVTIHDRAGSLWPFLPPERFEHQHPLCIALKATVHRAACIAFDGHRLHREIYAHPTGRVQICHAGLVECVAPVVHGKILQCILYAGPYSPSPGLMHVARDTTPRPAVLPWPQHSELPPPIEDQRAALVLENLRQLAARLSLWFAEVEQLGIRDETLLPAGIDPTDPLLSRRLAIRTFIQQRHCEPVSLADLARWLRLSESRAGHVVKETFGTTFTEVLTEARLRTATALLRHSNLSVLEIARRSGYDDISHFHRCFRRRMRATPLQYRKIARETEPSDIIE